MIKVVTMIGKEIVSKVSFDETTDDTAMKKALVECDRAIWSREIDSKQRFVVALMQDNRVLRYMNDTGWHMPRNSVYQ